MGQLLLYLRGRDLVWTYGGCYHNIKLVSRVMGNLPIRFRENVIRMSLGVNHHIIARVTELAQFADWFDPKFTSDPVFDSPTVVMPIVVTFVSSLVHLHPISYMSEDPHSPRFMCYSSIPIFSTPMSVTGDNFLQLFLGWEGVGPAPYLSINSWSTRLQADKAATKAMPVNRVGDFGSTPKILGRSTLFQTVDSPTIFASASAFFKPKNSFIFCNMRFHTITVIPISPSIGVVGKFAQIGSHTRSPDATEGPTPIFALIHAATMVTSGISVIARCSPSFEYSPMALIVITFAGAMMSFSATTTRILQNDSKRVIAHPTHSQSGYMIPARGISNYSVSVSHSMNHAFPKALLFSSASPVIHAMSDEQDMRKIGGLASSLPFTYAMMLIGSLSPIGFPFPTGFYSKDVIPELTYTKYTISGDSYEIETQDNSLSRRAGEKNTTSSDTTRGGYLTRGHRGRRGMHFFSKKIHSRTFRYSTDKERNGKRNSLRGSRSNQQPDRVVIMNVDRESLVILEADRLQIPIVSPVDSNIPLGFYKGITHPIPSNDSIQFVYPSRNSITKIVPPERGKIVAMKETVEGKITHQSTFSNENYQALHQFTS
eukprot:Gb_34377 [translate_table: standard]